MKRKPAPFGQGSRKGAFAAGTADYYYSFHAHALLIPLPFLSFPKRDFFLSIVAHFYPFVNEKARGMTARSPQAYFYAVFWL
jgi:hypothetical protein